MGTLVYFLKKIKQILCALSVRIRCGRATWLPQSNAFIDYLKAEPQVCKSSACCMKTGRNFPQTLQPRLHKYSATLKRQRELRDSCWHAENLQQRQLSAPRTPVLYFMGLIWAFLYLVRVIHCQAHSTRSLRYCTACAPSITVVRDWISRHYHALLNYGQSNLAGTLGKLSDRFNMWRRCS